MKISRSIARCGLFCLILSASALRMHAQDNQPPERKKRTTEGTPQQQQRRGQDSQQRTAAPSQQTAPQHERREVDRSDRRPHTPPSGQPAQGQVPQSQPQTQQRPQTPVQTPQTREAQPGRTYGDRPASQPGRTFGDRPAAQPGRTFGNPPAREAEPPRGQSQIGVRSTTSPSRTYTTRTGDVIHRDSRGDVRQVRMTNGTVVYHPPNAPRRVEVVRPGGRVVVASAPGHGYVQRPVMIRNTTIIKRTYIYNGIPQARIYRPRVYNGITLAIYTPVRYYRPTFYAYAYNPWPRPIAYGWGWAGRPWYGYYGGYFTPYPVYASPSLWLTDYLIAATLEAAYQERMADRAASAGNMYVDSGQSAPMSPEVKQAIADEVRRQIDRERAEGQSSNAFGGQDSPVFADNGPHVFVVHATFAVNSNAGECSIGEGDVLQMNSAPPANSPYADLIVLSSRGRDCRRGSTVSVALEDLQEMQNQMRSTIDRGLGDLQSRQGQGGLPMPPEGSTGTIDSPYAQEAQPDANAERELSNVTQEADRDEQQAVTQATPTLTLGLTIDEVKGIQGEPQKIVDLGAKKIYVYKDLKITFSDGKVSDIQ
jgi:hypothetical protein